MFSVSNVEFRFYQTHLREIPKPQSSPQTDSSCKCLLPAYRLEFQSLACEIPVFFSLWGMEMGQKLNPWNVCVFRPSGWCLDGQEVPSIYKPLAKRSKKRQTGLRGREHSCSMAQNMHPRSQIMVSHIAALLTLFFDASILVCTLCLFLFLISLPPTQFTLKDGNWHTCRHFATA